MVTNRDESEIELKKINENIETITKELTPLSKHVDKLRQKIVQLEKEQTKKMQEENFTNEKMEELQREIGQNADKVLNF